MKDKKILEITNLKNIFQLKGVYSEKFPVM
jgi:hypothetical protein